MLERITNHPVSSALWAGAVFLGTIAGVWYFFTSQAPGPVLLAMMGSLLSLHAFGLFLVAIGIILPLAVFGVITASAVQNKREVERLSGDLERSQVETAAMRQRLVGGDFLVRVYTPEFSALSVGLVTLKTKGEAIDMGRLLTLQEIAEEHKEMALNQAELIAERDAAIAALKDRRNEYASETFSRYSHLKFKRDGGDVQPHVTIRYCSYGGDLDIAKKMQGVFERVIHWPVVMDAANNPPLPRADQFKVIFDHGMAVMTFGDLERAFRESDVLEGIAIGHYQFVDREDSYHLIVSVLPSASASAI
jgi:hypothetical protein